MRTTRSLRRVVLLAVVACALVPGLVRAETNPPEPGQDPWPRDPIPQGCQHCGEMTIFNPSTGRQEKTLTCTWASVTTPEPKGTVCEIDPDEGVCIIRGSLCYFA